MGMTEKKPILVECTHEPEYVEEAKKLIDKFAVPGEICAVELYKFSGQEDVFFFPVAEYAKEKGMIILPIDSEAGLKFSKKTWDSIDALFVLMVLKKNGRKIPIQETLVHKEVVQLYERVPNVSTEEIVRLIQKMRYLLANIVSRKRTEFMLSKLTKTMKTRGVRLIFVGAEHGRKIGKKIPCNKKYVGSKMTRLQSLFSIYHPLIAHRYLKKFFRKLKRKFTRRK